MSKTLAFPLLVPAALGLCLLVHCGGGAASAGAPPAAPATALHYTSPGTTGFRLEADPASNDTAHLVLNLLGPAGTQIEGAALFLSVNPAQVTWGHPAGGLSYAKAGSVLDLTLGGQPSVQLFKSKLSPDSTTLQVGIFQKQGAATIAQGAPLVSVVLDLGPSVTAGASLSLAAAAGKQACYLDETGTLMPMNGQQSGTIAVGSLTAR